MRKLAISFLLTLPLVTACEPPPATATPTDAAPDTPAAADASPTAEAAPAKEAPKADADALSQADLPSAVELLTKSIEAVGGKDKVASVKSFYSESVVDIKSQGLKIEAKMWWKQGSFYIESDMPGVGLQRAWKTADGQWSDDPINGFRKLEGKEAAQAAWANTLTLAATWKDFFVTAETKTRRRQGGKVVLDILLTGADGGTVTLSVDEETSRISGMSFTQSTPMGDMPVTTTVQSYKDFDGFAYPVVTRMDMSVVSASTTVTKFEVNAEIDDKRFAPPKPKSKSKSKSK